MKALIATIMPKDDAAECRKRPTTMPSSETNVNGNQAWDGWDSNSFRGFSGFCGDRREGFDAASSDRLKPVAC